MSLHALLCKREEEKRPIRIGMSGAGGIRGHVPGPIKVYTRHAGGWSGGSEFGKSAQRLY